MITVHPVMLRRTLRGLASLLAFAALATAGLALTQSAAAATARPAASAGSSAIGSTSYAVANGAVYVSTAGSDSAPGSRSAPVRSLKRALTLAPSGGMIVLRGGSYNESAPVTRSVTLQNFPGEAVWLDGSIPVRGWIKDGSAWRRDGWTTRFDHSPTYTKGAPDNTQPGWRFVNQEKAPMAAHPDQMWIGGKPLKQVQSRSNVVAGRFYLDEGTSKLYIGSDPTGLEVRASTLQQALNVRASDVTIRGIGIRRYAPSVWQVGAITLEKPNAVVENVVVSEMATTGLSVQSSNARLNQVTIRYSGMLGLHGRFADGLKITRMLSRRNNSESFNIAPNSGGAKLGATRGVTVTDSSFSQNNGPGFWEDLSVYNSVFRGSDFIGNAGDGLYLEISAKVVVGDSFFSGNRLSGIKVNNTSDVKVWNNTFVGNARPLNLVQDSRRNTDSSDQAVDPRIAFPDPAMPWQLGPVRVSNNVFGSPTTAANCLICVEDYSGQESAAAMKITTNGNVYYRESAQRPTWLAVWSRGAGNPQVFTTLSAFRSATGQEVRGREYVGTAAVSSVGALSSTVTSIAAQIALPLPSDVAAAIKRPAGSTQLGVWGSASTTPPPTTTAPAPSLSTAPGTTVAIDDFERQVTGGWGSADRGGNWTVPTMANRFGVSAGAATVVLEPGDGLVARLATVSSTTTSTSLAFSTSTIAAGPGHFISVIGRDVQGAGDYRAKIGIDPSGKVAVWLVATVAGREQVLAGSALSALTYRPGEALRVKLRVAGAGTTTVQAKVWKAGTAEPGSWGVTAQSTTSTLQKAGAIGLYAYTTGARTTIYFDNLVVSTT